MSKKDVTDKLSELGMTKEEMNELANLLDEITNEAKDVIDDYNTNPSEELQDTVTQVHADSNILKTREERLLTPDIMNDASLSEKLKFWTDNEDVSAQAKKLKKNLDNKEKRS